MKTKPYDMQSHSSQSDANLKPNSIMASDMDRYQTIQYQHDTIYHSEIVALGVSNRMKHIALHLIKYLAKLSLKGEGEKKIAFIDTYIMLVSACNTLSLRISSQPNWNNYTPKSEDVFLSDFLHHLGDLAKACESCDHQENFPIRETWNNSTLKLLSCVLSEANRIDTDILESAVNRLSTVEKISPMQFALEEKK